MGNSQSNRMFFKLHAVMPPVNYHGGGDNPLTGWLDKSTKPFVSDDDRKQFIYATITVMTENGALDLRDHDFRLLYSRRNADRLVARLVAEKEGVIRAQVVAAGDGKNQIEAFQALRRHVETRLDAILSGLPGPAPDGDASLSSANGGARGPAAVSASAAEAARPASTTMLQAQGGGAGSGEGNGRVALPSDAPPAYGKAVKDWRTPEEKKS